LGTSRQDRRSVAWRGSVGLASSGRLGVPSVLGGRRTGAGSCVRVVEREATMGILMVRCPRTGQDF
jgi:hypothetical protein